MKDLAPPALTEGSDPQKVSHLPGPGIRDFGFQFFGTIVANTLIGGIIAAFGNRPFVRCLIDSQCIGLSIFSLAWILKCVRRLRRADWATFLVAVPLGALVGIVLAAHLAGVDILRQLTERPRLLAFTFIGALLLGNAISYHFYVRGVVAEGKARLREEMLERLMYEQRLTEANLKLLQAQIEPHFLFNTLSNIIHLIEKQPQVARRMLLNLTSYLRGSLQRTRSGRTTLGEELDLICAYLEIQAERMGPRLAYRIDVAPELRAMDLPPLLIQPLVENAVRHGLEPKPAGGTIVVRAAREGENLVLEVKDTGLGLSTGNSFGVGLSNVRSRVKAVSHGRGCLTIHPNSPEGLYVRVTLPSFGWRGWS